jgi:hypothetical protein
MAGQRTLKCLGPSYHLAERKAAVQRAVNWYLMRIEGAGEDSPLALESAPGLDLLYTFAGEVQGIHEADGRLFVAANSVLYEYVAGSFVSRGSIASGRVDMTHGTNQLLIVNGPFGWALNLSTNALQQITSSGWLGSYLVDELDGYFIFARLDSDQFYVSQIDDGTVFDALDFSSADAQPDLIIAQIVKKRELYLFGSRSCEVWINSGSPDFPFARYQGTPIDVGVVGRYAVTRAADTLIFVGQTERGGGIVYEMQGYQPVRISTQAVEEALAESSDLSEASCWVYQDAGGEFVAINAPGLESTWVWDAATREWHERAELVEGAYEPLRVTGVAYHRGEHYAIGGDKIYRMSREYDSYAGDPMARERTWPHLRSPDLEPISYRGLELVCSTGQKPTAANITLEISNDGGAVYGPPLLRSLGVLGQRMQRVRWLGLGTAIDRVYRLRCTDAVRLTITAATVDA